MSVTFYPPFTVQRFNFAGKGLDFRQKPDGLSEVPMKNSIRFSLTLAALLGAVVAAQAQEVGRVISSTPMMQKVDVQRQVCAGNAADAAVSSSAGKSNCTIQTVAENRTTYNVVYEYAGRQYQAQMAQDPGATVQLQVTPVGAAGDASNTAAANAPVTPPTYVADANGQVYPVGSAGTYVAAPAVYAAPYPYYSYPYAYGYPFFGGVSIGLGFYGHGRGHWR